MATRTKSGAPFVDAFPLANQPPGACMAPAFREVAPSVCQIVGMGKKLLPWCSLVVILFASVAIPAFLLFLVFERRERVAQFVVS